MISFLFSVVVAISFQTADAQWKVGQAVRTASGEVTGRASALFGNSEVSEYLGIPYAAPPVGPLRWEAPQPFKGNKSIAATSWGPSCPSSGGGATRSQDEDCLTLNVWTKPQTGEKAKAVLVSIYGGGFNTGSSNTRHLHGAPLANQQDVIVVSMNYRLNILGFPGAPGLKAQNLGMLDIRAAVEWVRDNIAAFGGDPKRISIFGESAGGGAVDYYSFAWVEDPIVAGYIPQSGSVFTRGIAAASNLEPWYKASQRLGCGGAEAGEKTTACMKTKDWKSIMDGVDTGPRVPGKTFGPTFDEKVIFKDYAARAKAGQFAKKPIFTGNTDNEGGFFRLIRNVSVADVKKLDSVFTCVAMKSSQARVDHKVPVWRYRFFGDFANNRYLPDMGAYHGSELPLVYGSPKLKDSPEKSTDTPEEAALTKEMMTAWASFAKDPENGLNKLGYKQYDPKADTLILFGHNGSGGVTYGSVAQHDADCARYDASDDSIDVVMGRSGQVASIGGFAGLGGILQQNP